MTTKHRLLLVLLTLACTPATGKTLPFTLPNALQVNGKPIAPACFVHFTGEPDTRPGISLRNAPCLKQHFPYNDYALKRGFLGYNMESKARSMRLPSIFYRYVGELNTQSRPHYVFEVNWSGGGTGFFSSLILLERQNETLSLVKVIDGGDRCTGGIHDARIVKSKLLYEKNTTPQMIFEINQAKTSKELLFPDCAVCCIGSITLVGGKITGFKFSGEIPAVDKNDERQHCFSQILQKAGANRKAKINSRQIKALQEEVNRRCLGS